MKIKCGFCDKEVETKDRRQKFCSRSCAGSFNGKGRLVSKAHRRKVRKALTGYRHPSYKKAKKICEYCKEDFIPDKKTRKFCSVECFQRSRGNFKKEGEVSYRTFMKILRRAFTEWKCPFCDWSLTFQVHHINGRHDNDLKSLVMLCPNHHSIAHSDEHFDKNDLTRFSIGNTYTLKELLARFYNGKNTKIDFKKHYNKKYKDSLRERGRAIVKLN